MSGTRLVGDPTATFLYSGDREACDRISPLRHASPRHCWRRSGAIRRGRARVPRHGYTTLRQEDFAYDLKAMSGALESFFDAVGLERPSLVGHSWGGAVSTYFAERNSERVDKLVLIAAPLLDDPSSWTFRSLEFPVVGELTGKLMGRSMFADTLTGGAFEHDDRISDDDIDEYWLPLSKPENREAMWKLQRGLDLSQIESRLGDIRSETLILWGDQDQWVEPWQAAKLGDCIPHATVRMLRGCGHNVHEDCPNRAIPALSGFLRQDEVGN